MGRPRLDRRVGRGLAVTFKVTFPPSLEPRGIEFGAVARMPRQERNQREGAGRNGAGLRDTGTPGPDS
jgi:hypothetical protein